MRELLNPEDARIAEQAIEKLRVATVDGVAQLSIRDEDNPLSPHLTLISEAIRSRTQVRFAYVSRSGDTSYRVLDPHQLLQLQGAWYVEGWCHERNATRMFRVEFMHDIVIRDEAQLHPEPSVSERAERNEFSGLEVELLIDTDALYRIEAWNPSIVEETHNHRTRAVVSLVHESRVLSLVTQAPGRIEILHPQRLRSFVKDWADSMVTLYAQDNESEDSVHYSGG